MPGSQIGQTCTSDAARSSSRGAHHGAPPQALHGLQEAPQGLVLLQGGADLLFLFHLLLLLDGATLHAAEAGLASSRPADTSCGQGLGELLHHQRQQMGRERVHAGRHGEAWPKCEEGDGLLTATRRLLEPPLTHSVLPVSAFHKFWTPKKKKKFFNSETLRWVGAVGPVLLGDARDPVAAAPRLWNRAAKSQRVSSSPSEPWTPPLNTPLPTPTRLFLWAPPAHLRLLLLHSQR